MVNALAFRPTSTLPASPQGAPAMPTSTEAAPNALRPAMRQRRGTPMPVQQAAPMPQPQPQQAPAPAFNTNALAAAMPKPANPNRAGAVMSPILKGLAMGLGPEGYAQGQEQAQQARLAEGQAMQAKAKSALTWLQQTASIPQEQRAQFTVQNAQAIAQATGQPVEAVIQSASDPSAFSDQALQQGMASFSAFAGIAPTAPEAYTLAPGAQRFGSDGRMIAENPRSDKPAEVKVQVGGNGNYWEFDPNTRQWADSGVKAKQEGADAGGFTLGKDQVRYDANGKRIAAGPTGDGPVDPNAPPDAERIRLEREYAKDWKNVQTNFSDIDGQFKRIQQLVDLASRDPSARSAADLGLIVSFTKMLDPGSVAREGEVALTQQAASILGQVGNLPNQWINGKTTLPEETRRALLTAAREMYGVYSDTYQDLSNDYRATAERYQFNPDNVMMGYREPTALPPNPPAPAPQQAPRQPAPQGWGAPTPNGSGPMGFPARNAPQAAPTPPGGPQPGEVDEGYRFIGGDPGDPGNWEPVE